MNDRVAAAAGYHVRWVGVVRNLDGDVVWERESDGHIGLSDLLYAWLRTGQGLAACREGITLTMWTTRV